MFSSDDAPVLVTVPVPDGLTATAVTGILTAPTDFSRGWLEVTADGRLVSRVDFDAGQAGTGLPISVPLQGSRSGRPERDRVDDRSPRSRRRPLLRPNEIPAPCAPGCLWSPTTVPSSSPRLLQPSFRRF